MHRILFFASCLGTLMFVGCTERAAVPDSGPFGSWRVDAEPGAAAPMLARMELCNNGIDDDQNGEIDDGCVCTVGATQPCYPGWPSYAGVGVCTLGEQTCVARGSAGAWEACVGAIAPAAREACDGLDDDCDGLVDLGCVCEVGTTQPCFAGSAAQRGVGRCVAGVQACAEMDGPDGSRYLSWEACEGAIGPAAEICNGIDDDCDGVVDDLVEICDLVDNDCDGLIDEGESCGALPESYALSRFWERTGSGILPSAAPLHVAISAPPASECPPGEILIEDEPGHLRCAPLPPECPPGTHYEWTVDAWECVECDVLVQFGYIYTYERTCATAPRLACPPGLVPTYREDTRVWECIPECDNTEYDRAYHEGVLVCIPC